MLFGCHVAAALVAIGLLAGKGAVAAPGLVFYVGVGIPSWLIEAIARREAKPLSVGAHLFPPLAATPLVVRDGVWQGAGLSAWAGFLALQLISYWTTDPELNVNLAHRPSPELSRFVARPWPARLLLAATALATLCAAEAALTLLFKQ